MQVSVHMCMRRSEFDTGVFLSHFLPCFLGCRLWLSQEFLVSNSYLACLLLESHLPNSKIAGRPNFA